MLGINGWEFVIIMVVAMLVIGPERLPQYAEQLGSFVRRGRDLFRHAKERVDDEFGPQINDVDWSKLDPRQYDPRKIVRDALFEDNAPVKATRSAMWHAEEPNQTSTTAAALAVPGEAPYDDEAT